MLYEFTKPVSAWDVGDTIPEEELKAVADIPWLLTQKAIRPVGFINSGDPLSDAESARLIREVQEKLEREEESHELTKAELKTALARIKSLDAGHAEGSRQLQQALMRAEQAEQALKRKEAGK